MGRPSIPPERLLRAQLLQLFYSIRSERMLMEQLDYNILFRWFVGLEMDEPVWVPTVFTKNRDRLLTHEIARSFFQPSSKAQPFLSDEQFTVDGTLIEAWASHKSFQRKDDEPGDGGRSWHGERRSNETHVSKTDPDARLYKKTRGAKARLAYLGHVLIENRHGLIVEAMATQADGGPSATRPAPGCARTAPADAAHRWADKNFDTAEFVEVTRGLQVTPHVAQNAARTGGSAIDARTTRHEGMPKVSGAPACRAGVRVAQDGRVAAQDQTPRVSQRRMADGLRVRGIQRETPHRAARGVGGRMSPHGPALARRRHGPRVFRSQALQLGRTRSRRSVFPQTPRAPAFRYSSPIFSMCTPEAGKRNRTQPAAMSFMAKLRDFSAANEGTCKDGDECAQAINAWI